MSLNKNKIHLCIYNYTIGKKACFLKLILKFELIQVILGEPMKPTPTYKIFIYLNPIQSKVLKHHV